MPSTIESAQQIVELVRSLVVPLVEEKDAVYLESSDTEDGALLVEIGVDEQDMGKVIGRQGRVIKAIRTLARAAGSRNGIQSVEVELIED